MPVVRHHVLGRVARLPLEDPRADDAPLKKNRATRRFPLARGPPSTTMARHALPRRPVGGSPASFALALLLVLVACGSGTDPSATSGTTTGSGAGGATTSVTLSHHRHHGAGGRRRSNT